LNEEQEQFDYTMNISINDVRLMHHCVIEAIRTWPGSPARPAEEQEHMWHLRDQFQRMMLDYSFRNS
jgi:hypothetical protein